MSEAVKVCRICKEEKPLSDYWVRKKNKDGLFTYCNSCASSKGSIAYQKHITERRAKRKAYGQTNKAESSQRSKNHYAKPTARAKLLLAGVIKRSKYKGWDTDIDYDFIKSGIDRGFCEVTNMPFDLNSSPTSKKNPFAPSIDRIDSSRGYVKSNCRIVVWQFNMMKAEMSDRDLFTFCEIIVEMMRDKFTP